MAEGTDDQLDPLMQEIRPLIERWRLTLIVETEPPGYRLLYPGPLTGMSLQGKAVGSVESSGYLLECLTASKEIHRSLLSSRSAFRIDGLDLPDGNWIWLHIEGEGVVVRHWPAVDEGRYSYGPLSKELWKDICQEDQGAIQSILGSCLPLYWRQSGRLLRVGGSRA
jgi:hypothetical protein